MDVTYQVDEMEAASDAAAAPHTRTNRRVFVRAGEFYQAVGTTQTTEIIRCEQKFETQFAN